MAFSARACRLIVVCCQPRSMSIDADPRGWATEAATAVGRIWVASVPGWVKAGVGRPPPMPSLSRGGGGGVVSGDAVATVTVAEVSLWSLSIASAGSGEAGAGVPPEMGGEPRAAPRTSPPPSSLPPPMPLFPTRPAEAGSEMRSLRPPAPPPEGADTGGGKATARGSTRSPNPDAGELRPPRRRDGVDAEPPAASAAAALAAGLNG